MELLVSKSEGTVRQDHNVVREQECISIRLLTVRP